MFETWINNILGRFLDIELTSGERSTAVSSVKEKYAKAFRRSCIYGILSIPVILFLDTSIIVSVLIPITMVAGTAWFSISLANMKQKFEHFGLELTANLFEAFSISLGVLFLLSIFALSAPFWEPTVRSLPNQPAWQAVSVIFGIVVMGNIVYKIFIGSMKYDMNDAMLTGQNEAAEKYYRKALSLLNSVASSLKAGRSLQVANYYIGVAFFEIYTYIRSIGIVDRNIDELLDKANTLIKNPSLPQEQTDAIALNLIKTFVSYCVHTRSTDSQKSLEALNDEIWCLEHNKEESQEMVDTRLSVVFQEIASLLENEGETLFINKENKV